MTGVVKSPVVWQLKADHIMIDLMIDPQDLPYPKWQVRPDGSSLHPSENLPLNRNGRSSPLPIRDVRFA
jgi:hypothetical protein